MLAVAYSHYLKLMRCCWRPSKVLRKADVEDPDGTLAEELEEEPGDSASKPPTLISVVIIRARNIAHAAKVGSTYFVECQCEGEIQRSANAELMGGAMKGKAVEIVWLQRLTIPADDPEEALVVRLKKHDVMKPAETIGTCDIPCAAVSNDLLGE